VQPVFLGNGYGSIDEGVPSLARLQGVGLWLTGENLDAYYDPAQSTVSNGIYGHYNRSIWFPVTDKKPEVRLDGKDKKSQFDIRFELSYDKKKESFTGKGFLSVNEAFNRYDKMIGLNDETEKYLDSLVSSVLKDAKVTKFNPTLFNRREVVFGFSLELKCPEEDDYGRVPLKIGVPSGGISGRLPDDVHLYHQKRFSPIVFPGLMSQQVELKLNTEGIEIVLKPENRQIENQAGNFEITVLEKDDYIVINRRLSLIKTEFAPGEWPILKELLLADYHERNQDILLKLKKDESEDKKKK